MITTQPMRHAKTSRRARHKYEKPSRVERFVEEAQSPEQSSWCGQAARVLGMIATVGATLTAAAGVSIYHDSGDIEAVGNLLNPVAEHVRTTDEEIAAAEGFSNIDGLEHRQMEEAVMHGVACGTYATGISAVILQLLNEQLERKRKKDQS